MNGSVPFTASLDTCTDIRSNINITCFTPYNITVNLTGYKSFNLSLDVNRSKIVNVSMVNMSGDTIAPTINITNQNASDSLRLNHLWNVSAYITDDVALSSANITFNLSQGDFYNFTFSLSGTSAFISQNITINVTRGQIINMSVVACDSSNNCAINSTIITVANTPPSLPTILFPINNSFTNQQPLPLNVTYSSDSDGDSININYYINGIYNSTNAFNITLNGSDGNYVLNVTLDDGFSNTSNVTSNFTLDRVLPIVNTTMNKSLSAIFQNDIINVTSNVTDNNGLSFCQIIINMSGANALEIINISLGGGTTAQCSNSSKVTLSSGNVINYSIRINDSAGNLRTNDTIITVAVDNIAPAFSGRQPSNNSQIGISSIQMNITISEVGNSNTNITQLWHNATGIWALNQSDNWTNGVKYIISQRLKILKRGQALILLTL
jgi:hypothetical protein